MKLAILAWMVLSQEFFTATKTLEEMANQQAVIETTRGEFIIEFLPEKAPNHVGYFMKLVEEGAYNGTAFHRLIKYGIVQGGDPTTKDVDAVAQYGTGGLGVLKRELSDELHIRGALSAVQVPGDPDSAGSQFFIVVTDQPALDGQYTVFARVVLGINLIQTISETPTDENGLPTERIEIKNVTLRDKPPPEIPPFSTETVEELATYRAVLETSFGEITMELFPHLAPNHVRNFLRLAKIGLYDGVTFHRVVPRFRDPDRVRGDPGRAPVGTPNEVFWKPRAGVQRHVACGGHRFYGSRRRSRKRQLFFFWFSCRFGGSDLCWRAWPMDAAAIVENAGNSGRERRLGKGCEHVQTWSGVFHNRLENASRFPRAPTGPS